MSAFSLRSWWSNEYLPGLAAALCLIAAACTTAHAQTFEYIHTDALGSPVAVTDAARNVIERIEYEPYGRILTASTKNGPGFTGHVLDAATELSYMQQRYYDPALGGFLSVDPVTVYSSPLDASSRYRYANNNPYRFKDPDGRKCTTTDGVGSCKFDEFRDKKGREVTRDAALGGKLSQLFGRGSRILSAEKAMTSKYAGGKALAAEDGAVTIRGNSSLGIADKVISGSSITQGMERIVTIANEGPAPNDTATLRHDGGVPSTLDGSPSPGPMRFWNDGFGVDVKILFAHEILHTIYSGVAEKNRGWANPDYQMEHQAPFNEAANEF
jgi:RHS repeat-associated protein